MHVDSSKRLCDIDCWSLKVPRRVVELSATNMEANTSRELNVFIFACVLVCEILNKLLFQSGSFRLLEVYLIDNVMRKTRIASENQRFDIHFGNFVGSVLVRKC